MTKSSTGCALSDQELALEGQLRECYGRVVYSHKTHEKCSDILLSRLACIKVWQIILSAVTTGGFATEIFDIWNIGVFVGGIASTLLLVLNTYTKDYDLGEIAQKHKHAANEIWLIREKYLSLLTDLRVGSKPLQQVQEERDRLMGDLHAIYVGSPSTNFKAYTKAQDALQNKEDMTFSDAEIDAFLPSELKRS
ncbi:SLATT domain-containing protein [Shewanella insulae]|uniref:SLATT domain-containing protein n=1 Tax=Shewanella insulae TaxID=2681496 RepID=UPI001EFCC2DD|nr:SLATT domain-containing protein [Shewanella insulae]MCG9738329.1 SLATT domain-containing protein [Shewanella insulae]